MNIHLMNKDVNSPAFIRAGQTNNTYKEKRKSSRMRPVYHIRWFRIIELTLLIAITIGGVYLLSKLVTPQVVTAVAIIVSFLVLRFIVRFILHVTFAFLRYLFWVTVLVILLLCVF